jgi:hypothetical protein
MRPTSHPAVGIPTKPALLRSHQQSSFFGRPRFRFAIGAAGASNSAASTPNPSASLLIDSAVTLT